MRYAARCNTPDRSDYERENAVVPFQPSVNLTHYRHIGELHAPAGFAQAIHSTGSATGLDVLDKRKTS
jgi:hypothetical protein